MLIKSGFTLVELLVVIAILSILSTLGISNFQSSKIKARDLSRKSDLQTIAKSLESYVNDHRLYPLADASGQIICQSETLTACPWGSPFSDGTTTYLPALPLDVSSNLSYVYASSGSDFTLYAHLENTQDPKITTFTPAVSCGSVPCNYKLTSSNLP